MRFQNVIHDIVARLIESQCTEYVYRYEKICFFFVQPYSQQQIYDIECKYHVLRVHNVELDEVYCSPICKECSASIDGKQYQKRLFVLAPEFDHSNGEELDKHRNCIWPHCNRQFIKHLSAELYTHHKIYYCADSHEQEYSGHSLTVEHDEECKIDECASGFALANDYQHWQQYYSYAPQEVLIALYIEFPSPDVCCKHERCRYLHELCRLQTE